MMKLNKKYLLFIIIYFIVFLPTHASKFYIYVCSEDECFESCSEEVDYELFGKPHGNVRLTITNMYRISDPDSPLTYGNLSEMDLMYISEYDECGLTINDYHYKGIEETKLTPYRNEDNEIDYILITDHNDLLMDSIVRTKPLGVLFRMEHFNPQGEIYKTNVTTGEGRKIIQEITYYIDNSTGEVTPDIIRRERFETCYNLKNDEQQTNELVIATDQTHFTKGMEVYYEYIEFDSQDNWTKRIMKIDEEYILEKRVLTYYDE